MQKWSNPLAAVGLAASVTLASSILATPALAAESYPTVRSAAGIQAEQITGAGASQAAIDAAIQKHIESARSQRSVGKRSTGGSVGTLSTGGAGYYSYCEEGSSGLMSWTTNSPSNCYGNYYEYKDGYRVSKVNMLRMKAFNDQQGGVFDARLETWCKANTFMCAVVASFLPAGTGKIGAYLGRIARAR
jgi:hypothetical protein